MRRALPIFAVSLLAAAGAPSSAESSAGAGGSTADAADAWGRVLAAHAHRGGLDYSALAADRADLDRYLESLAAPLPPGVSEDDRIAFWSNAYNAVVAHFVLERYPGIESVRDVDGFFDRLTFRVAGEERTLDQIEAEARKLDARTHFAVVCASTSCPDLRPEPFEGPAIDRQLDEQTRAFLAQPKGMRWDPAKNVLHLSSIFKWYAGDFTGGSTVVAFFARGGVLEWVLPYLPEALAAEIERADPSIRYLDYDWGLNDRPAQWAPGVGGEG